MTSHYVLFKEKHTNRSMRKRNILLFISYVSTIKMLMKKLFLFIYLHVDFFIFG